MNLTVEVHAAALEKKKALLAEQQQLPNGHPKDWRRTVGIFANDPDFEEAVRLGREYRGRQTWEKEVAGS